MNKKAVLAIEIVWITLGLLCLTVTFREIIITKGDRVWIFGLMSAVAFLMARIRDRQRKKM